MDDKTLIEICTPSELTEECKTVTFDLLPVKSEIYTPPEVIEAKTVSLNSLPEKSKKTYEKVYKFFMDWMVKKNTNSFSEDNLLIYFTELAQKYKSSSLWTIYSMLKATLNVRHNINIENYPKLVHFLKQQSEGYQAKQATVFTPYEVREFIEKAPDNKYLAMKVAFIMGITGCCRVMELYKMKVKSVHDHRTAFLVDILHTENKVDRQFSITGPFYNIVKKYIDLRLPNTAADNFFMNFRNGKCTVEAIGINKFRSFGKEIAKYLKLPSPEKYTGHSLRRSSATIHAEGGANLIDLHGGWKASSVAESYVERTGIVQQVLPCSSNNQTTPNIPVVVSVSSSLNNNNSNVSNTASDNLDINSTPCINLSNCNVTFNFHS